MVFIKELNNVVVYEKQELFTLDVTISKPQPKVTWYFKDKEIRNDKRHEIKCTNKEKTAFELVIYNVELSDDGLYSCKAGKLSTQGIVTVKGNIKCFPRLMINTLNMMYTLH